jgi:hypothetical protein
MDANIGKANASSPNTINITANTSDHFVSFCWTSGSVVMFLLRFEARAIRTLSPPYYSGMGQSPMFFAGFRVSKGRL